MNSVSTPLRVRVRLRYTLVVAAVIAFGYLLGSCATPTTVRFGGIEIPDQSGTAVTVLGAVDPSMLGQTLMHEHLYLLYWIPLDEPKRWKTRGIERPTTEEQLEVWHEPLTPSNLKRLMAREYYLLNKDAYTLKISDTLPEVREFKRLGGSTIVDMPPIEEPRRPLKLVELSRQSNVHIIVGTSFYTPAWHPENIDQLSVNDLTHYMIKDIVQGMDGTGVKAGIIGEVPAVDLALGADTNNETRILRAAARASRLTGAALSLHTTFRDRPEMELMLHRGLDIIEEEGVDPSRVVMGHVRGAPHVDLALLERLLARGIYLQFDTLGDPMRDSQPSVDAIASLIDRGYESQLLVSQDIYTKFHLRKFDGAGLVYVHTVLLPELRDNRVPAAAINHILVENPRRVLTFVHPQGCDPVRCAH